MGFILIKFLNETFQQFKMEIYRYSLPQFLKYQLFFEVQNKNKHVNIGIFPEVNFSAYYLLFVKVISIINVSKQCHQCDQLTNKRICFKITWQWVADDLILCNFFQEREDFKTSFIEEKSLKSAL